MPRPLPKPTDASSTGEFLSSAEAQPALRLAAPPWLVASTEPSVVFASLAAGVVPDLCSGCRIDIVDGVHGRYSIANPSRPAENANLERLLERAAKLSGHVLRMAFAAPEPFDDAPANVGATDWAVGFHGVATFVWDRRAATYADRELAGLLVDHAVRTVSWQRAERAARDAGRMAANLQIALRSSRQIGIAIGILMHSQKTTEDQAFELLTIASQHTHQKVRDIALDVAEIGCLDVPSSAADRTARRLRPLAVGRPD